MIESPLFQEVDPMFSKLITAVVAGSCLVVACNHADKSPAAAAPKTDNAPTAKADNPTVGLVSVSDVAKLSKDKSATIYDANGAETRAEFGVVPGAVLLSSHDSYPISELPSDKASKLVFYCGGTMCRASDAAAARASGAGYKDVSVMREGIKGWKAAGEPTETPRT
jgi:rhodanese-related sulfurtransferase